MGYIITYLFIYEYNMLLILYFKKNIALNNTNIKHNLSINIQKLINFFYTNKYSLNILLKQLINI